MVKFEELSCMNGTICLTFSHSASSFSPFAKTPITL